MTGYREIISYPEMVQREGIALQKGMNYRVRGGTAGYSIILMSVRKGAPYQDQWHDLKSTSRYAGMLEYEGHDAPRSSRSRIDPKTADQPLTTPKGKPTENGKFYVAAQNAKSGQSDPELVQVYEKIADGIWCNRGRYLLVDAEIKTVLLSPRSSRSRKVLRFFLRPTVTPEVDSAEESLNLTVSRQIPTSVKVEVWKRDKGRCVTCGATDNLHFDHDVPYSKGGSSLTPNNIKLLCARHNLQKSDKIL